MKHLKRKDLLLLPNKLLQIVPDLFNPEENHVSFLRKNNKISV